jgi:hypothetical protein
MSVDRACTEHMFPTWVYQVTCRPIQHAKITQPIGRKDNDLEIQRRQSYSQMDSLETGLYML